MNLLLNTLMNLIYIAICYIYIIYIYILYCILYVVIFIYYFIYIKYNIIYIHTHTSHYDRLSEDSKKRTNVLNKLEMLKRDFHKDDLPPLEVDDEVKLELEKTVAE